MRPVEVSPDQVREAGERLLAGGKRVNGWSLRRALDNRGRPDRLMQVWEQERDAAVPQDGPQPDTAPVSLPPGIAEMAEQARTTLVAQIDGIVLDLPTAFYVVNAQLDDGSIVGQLPPGAGAADQFGMVLALDSPLTACVSRAVDALRDKGTLAELEKKWLSGTGGAPVLS